MNWEQYSFVIRGKCRKKVLFALEIERTPTQIAKITKMQTSHVSRALAELVEKNAAICLTPKNIVGKIYALTEEGKEIKRHLEESEGKKEIVIKR